MMELDYDVIVVSAPTDDGWYGVQEKGFGGAKAGLGYLDFQPSFGFVSRPLDATIEADGTPVGCTQFIARLGRTGGFAWLGHDPRYTDKCPPVTRGSSAQWNARGAFQLFDYDTETSTLYVPRNGGLNAHTFVVGQDANGVSYTELRHQNGAYITQRATSTVVRHTGNALVEVKSDAVNINGKVNLPTSLSVGGAAAQPLVNATLLATALHTLASTLTSAGAAPIVSSALGGTIEAIALLLDSTCKTQFIKGV